MNWRNLAPLTALRAFAVAAEHRSLTKAGAALNVTHAAISQQIRILERHIGTSLVTRNRRGITLTPQGEYLAQGLRRAFTDINLLVETLTAADAARPILVSATPMFASAVLMPRLASFMAAHTDIELNLQSTIEAVELAPGGVDMAIRYGTGAWQNLETELLLPGCLTVVAARKLVGERVFSEPGELLEYPLLQEHASVEFDLWLEKVGVPASAKRKAVRVPGNMLLDGIRRGDGIGATVRAFIADELKSGELVALFDDPIADIGYYIVTLPGAQRPPLRTFIRWLKGVASDFERNLSGHDRHGSECR